jgi:hypothetical protein
LRVLDFGASHKLPRDWRTADDEWPPRAPVATPGYASCQLLEGLHPDARDDLFAFACVAYVLLSGRHPFPNLTAIEACAQRVRPRRPPGLTGRQWRALREGLRWERDRRPSDVLKWLERFDLSAAAPRLPSLQVLANAPPAPNRGVLRAAAAISILALLAAGAYWSVTNYDSLAQRITDLTSQARSALENARLLPAPPLVSNQPPPPVTEAAPAPRATVPAAPAAPVAPTGASPTGAAPARVAPTSASPAGVPSTLSSPTSPSRLPGAAPPTAAAGPRPVAPARPANEPAAPAGTTWQPRIELAADTVDVPASETTALVIVHRKGSLRGEANFTWWTESGTAKPARDFTPVMPHVESIANGSGSLSLSIPVSGTARSQPRSFYVVIDQSESGAALGARTLTMVTLLPTE